jgi:hypothetical protein
VACWQCAISSCHVLQVGAKPSSAQQSSSPKTSVFPCVHLRNQGCVFPTVSPLKLLLVEWSSISYSYQPPRCLYQVHAKTPDRKSSQARRLGRPTGIFGYDWCGRFWRGNILVDMGSQQSDKTITATRHGVDVCRFHHLLYLSPTIKLSPVLYPITFPVTKKTHCSV